MMAGGSAENVKWSTPGLSTLKELDEPWIGPTPSHAAIVTPAAALVIVALKVVVPAAKAVAVGENVPVVSQKVGVPP